MTLIEGAATASGKFIALHPFAIVQIGEKAFQMTGKAYSCHG